jgi:hypothetical protein
LHDRLELASWQVEIADAQKQRVHAVLLTHLKPFPVSDLFGVRGRQLLARLGPPEPWQATIEASLRLIDELEREITDCERELRRLGADHRYVPLLLTVPGIVRCSPTRSPPRSVTSRFPSPRFGQFRWGCVCPFVVHPVGFLHFKYGGRWGDRRLTRARERQPHQE